MPKIERSLLKKVSINLYVNCFITNASESLSTKD